jgi:hypothetical protein
LPTSRALLLRSTHHTSISLFTTSTYYLPWRIRPPPPPPLLSFPRPLSSSASASPLAPIVSRYFFFFVFFFLCLLFGVSEHRLALRSFRRRRRRRHSHRSDRRSSLGLDKVASHVRPVLSFISLRAITASPPAFESDGNPIRASRHFPARRDCFGRLPRRWSRASAGSLRSISARFLLG